MKEEWACMKSARKETKFGAITTSTAEEMTNASKLRKNHSLMIRVSVITMKEVVSVKAGLLIETVMRCQSFNSTMDFKRCS